MKATLEFDLPEEQNEHELAVNGASWMIVCSELDSWLRGMAKYEDRGTVSVELVRERLRELMSEQNLHL